MINNIKNIKIYKDHNDSTHFINFWCNRLNILNNK